MKVLVITGAGASYDVVNTDQKYPNYVNLNVVNRDWRPPLSNDLFGNHPNGYSAALPNYPLVKNLISYLQTKLRLFPDLEALLTAEYRNTSAHRATQFLHLVAYLQEAFYRISESYFPETPNNYESLVETLVSNEKIEKLTFVNFNYDLILDKAIEPNIGKFINPVDYIANNRLKYIKIHGSANWARGVDVAHPQGYSYYSVLNLYKPETPLGQMYVLQSNIRNDSNGVYFPLMLLPIHKEEQPFICPSEHITALKEAIETCDIVVSIGWKAGDQYLLDLLKGALKCQIIILVGNTSEGLDHIQNKFVTSLGNKTFQNFSIGFNAFMYERELDKILS